MMCRLLEISRSAYYAWVDRPASDREVRSQQLGARIVALHVDSDGAYGSPRLLLDLRAGGVVVSGKTVAKVMRDRGLRGCAPRQWRLTTVPEPDPANVPIDRVKRRFDQGRLDAVWVGDITQWHLGRLVVPGDSDRRALPQGDRLGAGRTPARQPGHRRAVHGRRATPLPDRWGRLPLRPRGPEQHTRSEFKALADRRRVLLSVGRTGVCWDCEHGAVAVAGV